MIGPGDLTEPVLQLASTFAEQVGLSVADIRLRDARRDQWIRVLTGLYDRRHLDEIMERETGRACAAQLKSNNRCPTAPSRARAF